MPTTAASYLALGDSYTIGEGVERFETWPCQLSQKLGWETPRVIAKTGWKTYELLDAIDQNSLPDQFDWVSLLIGVNNQYRQISFEVFKRDLELLANKINDLVRHPSQVFVISIPDYSLTPFVEDKDRQRIADELDLYNRYKKKFAFEHAYQFCDITPISQQAGTNPSLVCNDKLHPSAKQYALWTTEILQRCMFVDPV